MRDKKRNFFTILCLTCLFFNVYSSSASAAIQDYASLGINSGESYTWILSSVNREAYENLTGSYQIYIRDGKEMTYTIEKITTNSANKNNDNWSIDIEMYNLVMESDDDGVDGNVKVYKDPSIYKDNIISFIESMNANPVTVYIPICVIPLDAKAFLNEAAGLHAYLNASEYNMTYEKANIKGVFEYDVKGILTSLTIYYSGTICYIYTRAPGVISFGLYLIPISAVGIIAVIIYLKKKGKTKKI
jgi:hypothetical protein